MQAAADGFRQACRSQPCSLSGEASGNGKSSCRGLSHGEPLTAKVAKGKRGCLRWPRPGPLPCKALRDLPTLDFSFKQIQKVAMKDGSLGQCSGYREGGKGSTSGRTALALGALRDWECRTDSQGQPSTPPAWFVLCFTYAFPYFIYLAVSDHSHITWDLSLGLASSLCSPCSAAPRM